MGRMRWVGMDVFMVNEFSGLTLPLVYKILINCKSVHSLHNFVSHVPAFNFGSISQFHIFPLRISMITFHVHSLLIYLPACLLANCFSSGCI